jgi:hypothetical protein
MRTIHEVPSYDEIPTPVLIGSFFLSAAALVFLISFPLFRPFFAVLGLLLIMLSEFSHVFALICLIGFLLGLPFCAFYRGNSGMFDLPAANDEP